LCDSCAARVASRSHGSAALRTRRQLSHTRSGILAGPSATSNKLPIGALKPYRVIF
jgi:hypothetical protein